LDQRLANTADVLKAAGADWAILTRPDAVCYASGHVVPVEAGPSPFAGGPTTVVVGASGVCGLVAANVEGGAARASWAEPIELYEGFTFERPADPRRNYQAALQALLARMNVGGTIASDDWLDLRLFAPATCGEDLVDINPALSRRRSIKTTDELKLLQRSAEAASIGQRAFRTALRSGRTELEVFAEIRCAIETFAGERVPITGDFLSGRRRTAAFTGWPNTREIRVGDPVIADLAPRVAGYWGDSSTACMVGEATASFRRLFEAAYGALLHAVDIMRPGLAIRELDRSLRERVAAAGFAYPHHSGHSLGTSVHEWPRIVPHEAAVLETGMVLMVEPGAYDPEIGGVRTEWMIEVTAQGCRPLTHFDHSPSLAVETAADVNRPASQIQPSQRARQRCRTPKKEKAQ